MVIGYIEPYDNNNYKISAWHSNFESIPNRRKSIMPEWIELPNWYKPQTGMITLINKQTFELSFIESQLLYYEKTEQELKIEKLESAVDSIIISLLGV